MNRCYSIAFLALLGISGSFAQSTPPETAPAPQTAPAVPAITAEQKAETLAEIQRIISTRAFVPGVDFSKWPTYVEARKEQIDAAATPQAFVGQVNTAFRTFGFSHIRLSLDPNQRQRRTPRVTPTPDKPADTPRLEWLEVLQSAPATAPVGPLRMGVQGNYTPDGLLISDVVAGSPAEKAGLKPGETIMSVNGVRATSLEVVQGMPAERTLSVKGTDGKIREVKITAVPMADVTPKMEELTLVEPDAAVFRVMTFSDGYSRTNIEELLTKAKDRKFLILDLRSNGGGDSTNLAHLLSLFLPPDTPYGTFVNKTMAQNYLKEKPDGPVTAEAIAAWTTNHLKTRKRKLDPFPGKVAVLINRGTGSASEITAAALREQMKTPIVGTPSAGAVLASIFLPVKNGFQLQFPISDYITPKGIRLEGNPIQPDAVVQGRRTPAGDPAVDKALELLRQANKESIPAIPIMPK